MSDSRILARVLDELKLEYTILSDTQGDIFAQIDITQLALALAGQNCRILSIREKGESLESYYMNLTASGRADLQAGKGGQK